jgi:uridine kinase
VIAVIEGHREGVQSYIVMIREERSVALSEEYNRLSSMGRIYDEPTGGLARAFGRAVADLMSSGVVHEELDLKNVRLGTGKPRKFMFLEFERTRLLLDEPDEDVARERLGEAISRRLSRHHFDSSLVNAFADGYLSGGSTTPEQIARLVERVRQSARQGVVVVLIDGFAGSGKSCLANQLRSWLGSCTVIETDSFMRYSRRERSETKQRLHDHKGWYDVSKLGEVVRRVRNGETRIRIAKLYSHESGELDREVTLSIRAGSAVIVEGMYAMSAEITQLSDLALMLNAKRDVLLSRVTARDSSIRKIPASAIAARFAIINGKEYRSFFRSRSRDADLRLDTTCEPFGVLGGGPRVLRFTLMLS